MTGNLTLPSTATTGQTNFKVELWACCPIAPTVPYILWLSKSKPLGYEGGSCGRQPRSKTTFTRKPVLPVNQPNFLWTASDLALRQVQTLLLSVSLILSVHLPRSEPADGMKRLNSENVKEITDPKSSFSDSSVCLWNSENLALWLIIFGKFSFLQPCSEAKASLKTLHFEKYFFSKYFALIYNTVQPQKLFILKEQVKRNANTCDMRTMILPIFLWSVSPQLSQSDSDSSLRNNWTQWHSRKYIPKIKTLVKGAQLQLARQHVTGWL